MRMGRKCAVEGCASDSGRTEDTGVTFHKIPTHSDIRPKWFSLCHIPDDKKNLKVIYICSRHFLRADFCNFKGKKYVLKHGVLPSVFPWDKSKLEAIKAETTVKKEEPDSIDVKMEIVDNEITEIKTELIDNSESKNSVLSQIESNDKKPESVKESPTQFGVINFAINSRIEVLDFNDCWYPARILEVDYEENEVLIHFEKFSSKFDEWISMDSARLRPIQPVKKILSFEQYIIGERCLATWSDSRKFPATVTKILENDMYEVLFDDGFIKTLKAHRMSKAQGKLQSAPLFDPVKSTKQERRDKKRKLNVAALFGKRHKMDHGGDKEKQVKVPVVATPVPEITSPQADDDSSQWGIRWEDGKPVGIESTIDTNDGKRSSIIVVDSRLPTGWTKHLIQRLTGNSAGKWDCVFVSPENRRFRSKTEIRTYCENHPGLEYNEYMFDFSTSRARYRKNEAARKSVVPASETTPQQPQETVAINETEKIEELTNVEEEQPGNLLKIPLVDESYKCPIDGCGKNFRRENLAQMHVKHYHPEYTKFLDCTPNVADLAYARTVGENLDKSPAPPKPSPVRPAVKLPPKKTPADVLNDIKPPQSPPVSASIKAKDAEIIKLLSAKPFDKNEQEPIYPLPSGLPSNMYPDIKLKDLLVKTEGVPKRDDLNLKALCASRPPVGIKTLLPVNRQQSTENEYGVKRKRISESQEYNNNNKGNELLQHDTPTALPQLHETHPTSQHSQPPNNIIIEGGEVIKIVRMKQEEIINCTCGFTEEDGLMIQCELCLCWQHAYCNNIERESQVPEKYVCYICQNPIRERSSKKYFHDQDWLKLGTLPTASYHTKDEEVLHKRFEKLRKSHDIAGGLLELREYVHNLGLKLKIAEAKNHPKLYLWSKPWEKMPLPEKEELDAKPPKLENDIDMKSDSMLLMMLKNEKEVLHKLDLNTLMDNSLGQLSVPIIPQPEAAIDSTDCRINLLEHVAHSELLVEERLNDFEKLVDELDDGVNVDDPRMRQTMEMLLRDLDTLREFSNVQNVS